MPQAKVNGISIYYETQGEGKPILFLHGAAMDHNAWNLQVPVLKEHFKCIMYDARGCGDSDKPQEPYSIRMLASDAAALLDSLGIQKTHVVGNSMGGATAQELAINHPQKIDKLVLASSVSAQDHWSKTWHHGLMAIRKKLGPEEYGEFLSCFSYTYRMFTERYAELQELKKLTRSKPIPDFSFENQFKAMLEHNTLDRLHLIKTPTLVVVGEEDAWTPPRFSRQIAELIPNAKLITIKEASHSFFREKVDEANKILLNFLS